MTQPAPVIDSYVAATGNTGTNTVPLVLTFGTSAYTSAVLPRAGDVLVYLGGTNAAANYPQSITDTAGADWQAGPQPPSNGQAIRAFYAIAPRDYLPTDTAAITFGNMANQRSGTIIGSPGVDLPPLTSAMGNSAGSIAPTTGPFTVSSPALLIGYIQNGGSGGMAGGLSFGQTGAFGWQAATNQWHAIAREAVTSWDGPLSGTLSSSQAYAALALALPLRHVAYPLRAWDGADWRDLAATGAKVWDGARWLEVA